MRFIARAGVFVVIPAIGLSGCILSTTLPNIRFETPEAQGAPGKGHIGVGLAVSPVAELLEPTDVPPSKHRGFRTAGVLTVAGAIGLLNRLDVAVSATGGSGSAPLFFRAKYQVFGATANNAQAGDTSLAVLVGGGRAKESRTDTFGSGSSSTVAFQATALETALLIGTRVSNSTLIYSSVSFTSYRAVSDIIQSVNGNTTPFSDTSRIQQLGANFGLQWARRVFSLKLEGAFSRNSVESTKVSLFTAGALASWRW